MEIYDLLDDRPRVLTAPHQTASYLHPGRETAELLRRHAEMLETMARASRAE